MSIMREFIKARPEQLGKELLICHGLDDAILGVVGTTVAYSSQRIINVLMSEDGMTYDEAQEYFDFNIAGAKCEGCPIFVDDITE